MRAKKALRLPRPRDLQSNSLKDIQEFTQKAFDELDRQWRLLHQDVSTIQVDADGFIYFGNKETDGTWRIGRDGLDWVLENRVSGTWTRIGTNPGS